MNRSSVLIILSVSLSFLLQGCLLLLPFAEENEQAKKNEEIKKYNYLTYNKELYPFPRPVLLNPELTKLKSQLKSDNSAIRTTTVTTIGSYQKYYLLLADVKNLATDPSKNVRRAVVKTLAKIDSQGSIELLKKLSNDKDRFVSATAKSALAGDRRFFGPTLY